MSYRKEFYKNKIEELFDSYKTVVSLSMLAVAENNVDAVINLNARLKSIFESILDVVKLFDKESVYENLKNLKFNDLPENLKLLQTLETYNKLLALEYSKLEIEDINKKIEIIKLCVEFDYQETVHSIELAKLLYEAGKYREAIVLADFIRTIDATAPSRLVLAQAYKDLKVYGLSLAFYKEYLSLNENDKEIKQEMHEVFETMLKENIR